MRKKTMQKLSNALQKRPRFLKKLFNWGFWAKIGKYFLFPLFVVNYTVTHLFNHGRTKQASL